MKAYVFPGQGAQFSGMGKDLYESDERCREMFDKGNEILGFNITDVMFNGTDSDLKQTNVTQPAIFLHSIILVQALGSRFAPDMVAGHSLGEFSALAANRTLIFEDALRLVAQRAEAMQKACETKPSTMAAIIGPDDKTVEEVCSSIDDIIVPANYNTPGQLVISGSVEGVDRAIEILKGKGARIAIKLAVGGAFHSPFMEPARRELEQAINETPFHEPVCPVYQNVTGKPARSPEEIKENLVAQLTSPVKWTQTIFNMIRDGAGHFTEVGPGNVLQGLIKKADRNVSVESVSSLI
ncbi:MAG TPA: [acyl-carrier-protein] S-malonyltransferase [Bacteroidetes bacterium]|nr:[acyl-carrier-protein] S-malonyltransferase [Bacteroidota bacterium]